MSALGGSTIAFMSGTVFTGGGAAKSATKVFKYDE